MTLALTDERLRELAGWAARQNTTISDDLAALARAVIEARALSAEWAEFAKLKKGGPDYNNAFGRAADELAAILGERA